MSQKNARSSPGLEHTHHSRSELQWFLILRRVLCQMPRTSQCFFGCVQCFFGCLPLTRRQQQQQQDSDLNSLWKM